QRREVHGPGDRRPVAQRAVGAVVSGAGAAHRPTVDLDEHRALQRARGRVPAVDRVLISWSGGRGAYSITTLVAVAFQLATTSRPGARWSSSLARPVTSA